VRGLSAAQERDASDADARFFLGMSLEAAGREAEALAVGLRFRELDPLSPMAGLLLGSAYWFVGRPQEGLEPQEFALTIDPDNPILHWTLGYTHALLGNTSLARTHADWMRSSVPAMPYTTHLSALVHAMEGRRDEALTTLRALGPTTFDAHLTFHLSEAYALAGEHDTAIRLLADGVERGFHPYPYIATHCPFLAPLRETAAFAQVARRAAERVAEFHA
jgi:tetratricopeptide (TPR) repeat protein